ncbi:ATP-binding cassette domain-containing protein [Vibrio sp. S9_S30]|uniref:ATP-binding cassette domain-containing protein n=1 Tax=Vibrio sp. S9_S30 TaxID=2720226 RepID=UPI001680EE93|nr:ATP-binding cassette domain-containing protein [Vibrio sp. S9_S30]MBD1556705.1 ATP-binding cassette domain-containing protein [Vibrio sp. S9_S30]
MMIAVSVKSLTFQRGNRLTLNNVSFELSNGITILLGPNGSGKTTLFSLLTRLLPPQQGEIVMFGLPLNLHPQQSVKHTGVVFQQSALDLDLTGEQNLYYYGGLHGLSRAETYAAFVPLAQEFDLENTLKNKVRELNGGHRRRLEIVRAMLHSPRLLLLDEPSSGLDPEVRNVLTRLIRKTATRNGTCVLWATHLIDEVETSDNMLMLLEGNLIEQGNVSQLCQKHGCESSQELYNKCLGKDAI